MPLKNRQYRAEILERFFDDVACELFDEHYAKAKENPKQTPKKLPKIKSYAIYALVLIIGLFLGLNL